MTPRDPASKAFHHIGDGCPGGHYASPGPGGACCTAFYDTDGEDHAWNCQAAAADDQPPPGQNP